MVSTNLPRILARLSITLALTVAAVGVSAPSAGAASVTVSCFLQPGQYCAFPGGTRCCYYRVNSWYEGSGEIPTRSKLRRSTGGDDLSEGRAWSNISSVVTLDDFTISVTQALIGNGSNSAHTIKGRAFY